MKRAHGDPPEWHVGLIRVRLNERDYGLKRLRMSDASRHVGAEGAVSYHMRLMNFADGFDYAVAPAVNESLEGVGRRLFAGELAIGKYVTRAICVLSRARHHGRQRHQHAAEALAKSAGPSSG